MFWHAIISQSLHSLPVISSKATGIGRAVNRYRKRGDDIGDIASFLVTKWKELLKQETDGGQISSSKLCDEGVCEVRESNVEHVNNKHEKSKHKTAEIKSKVCTAHKKSRVKFYCTDTREYPRPSFHPSTRSSVCSIPSSLPPFLPPFLPSFPIPPFQKCTLH